MKHGLARREKLRLMAGAQRQLDVYAVALTDGVCPFCQLPFPCIRCGCAEAALEQLSDDCRAVLNDLRRRSKAGDTSARLSGTV